MILRRFIVNKSTTGGPQTVRVNVKTQVNAAAIRREKRNGRDVIIVPSATLPDGIVMNRVRYSAAEIEKSCWSLNGTPAPLGHPSLDGQFVSASDPRGMVLGFVGAWNENVRREGGRVLLDKVIDVAYAKQLDGGRAVIEAIDKGQPVHTSTGLYALMEATNSDDTEADFNARDIVFDHDAILLGEDGAATPAQGVGMLVNSALGPDGEKIEVINSALEDADRELDWTGTRLIEALERRKAAGTWEQLKAAILALFDDGAGRETSTNTKENDVDKEQFAALSVQVNALTEGMKGIANIGETITAAVNAAVKPVADGLAALQNAEKAKEEAELDTLRASIVAAGIADEATAKEITLNAARAIAKNLEGPKTAFAINKGFKPVAPGGLDGFQIPEGKA